MTSIRQTIAGYLSSGLDESEIQHLVSLFQQGGVLEDGLDMAGQLALFRAQYGLAFTPEGEKTFQALTSTLVKDAPVAQLAAIEQSELQRDEILNQVETLEYAMDAAFDRNENQEVNAVNAYNQTAGLYNAALNRGRRRMMGPNAQDAREMATYASELRGQDAALKNARRARTAFAQKVANYRGAATKKRGALDDLQAKSPALRSQGETEALLLNVKAQVKLASELAALARAVR